MLPFFLFIVCRTCLSFFLHSVWRFIFHTIGLTDVFHPCPASHLRSFSVILICSELFKFQHCSWLCSKCSISWAQCAEYKNRQALLSLWHSLVISENRNVLAKYHDQALNRNSSTRVLQRLRQRDYVHDFRTKFSRVPIDMLKIVDLIIISQIYGPQSLITLLRAVPALCWVKWNQSSPSRFIYLWSILILLSHLHRPSGIFSSLFPTKTLYAFIIFPCVLLLPPPLASVYSWSSQ